MIDSKINDLSPLDCQPLDIRESLEEPSLEGPCVEACKICGEPADDCLCCAKCTELGEICELCAEDTPREGEYWDEFMSRITGIPRQGPF